MPRLVDLAYGARCALRREMFRRLVSLLPHFEIQVVTPSKQEGYTE